MAALFLDHQAIRELHDALAEARVLVRRAERFTTKAESRAGVEAHKALHEAEVLLDDMIRRLG